MDLDEKVNLVVKQIIENLYFLRYGKTIENSSLEEKKEGIKVCYKYSLDYIQEYIQKKFSIKDSMRLKARILFGNDIEEKWPYINEEIAEAIDALILGINNTIDKVKTEYDSLQPK